MSVTNASLNFFISSSYYLRSASFGSSLILGSFLIDFALDAYLNVDSVSS